MSPSNPLEQALIEWFAVCLPDIVFLTFVLGARAVSRFPIAPSRSFWPL